MKLKLDDNHYLVSDGYDYWITVESISKNGKPYERRITGYCRTFSQAVDNYIDKRIKTAPEYDITEIRALLIEIKDMISGWEKKYDKHTRKK